MTTGTSFNHSNLVSLKTDWLGERKLSTEAALPPHSAERLRLSELLLK